MMKKLFLPVIFLAGTMSILPVHGMEDKSTSFPPLNNFARGKLWIDKSLRTTFLSRLLEEGKGTEVSSLLQITSTTLEETKPGCTDCLTHILYEETWLEGLCDFKSALEQAQKTLKKKEN